MLNIELYELKDMLMEAAMMGAAAAMRDREPKSDIMRQREAEEYLIAQGYGRKKLGELVENGLVKFHRLSEAKNSPSVCSRIELMAAVSAVKKRTITNLIH